MSMVSRTADESHGWKISCDGGDDVSEPEPAPHAVGTVIEVQDLFSTFRREESSCELHQQNFLIFAS